MPAKNATPGITTRHRAQCPARDGGRCRCKPTYRASVYDARSRKKIRKVFKSHAEAKQWQTDKRHAAKHGTLRPRSATTVRDEADHPQGEAVRQRPGAADDGVDAVLDERPEVGQRRGELVGNRKPRSGAD